MPPVSQETLDLLRSEARAYEHGEGVPKDVERAVSLYCDGARYGDAESQYSLGWMYANGRGVERNDDLAASFFQMAARQGHEPSQKMLRYVGEEPAALPECMTAKAPVDDGGGAFDENSPLQQYIYALVRQLAPEYGLSPRLVMAIIRTESNFEPGAISPKNAQGLMQLIPPTSARFNVRRPFDPEQNIRGGMAYLRWLLAYFEGDVSLVAAAYNAGEGAVNRYRGVPPYTETRVYVARILRLYEKVDHPFDPQIAAPSPEMPRIRRAMGGQFLRTGIQ
ncbi:MAG: transglycosylase SLT domain-containing protein [Candidatus Accumulibacter sp.]|nr:transglycosylase SLT domain-containing protein [Accumulibacter sp.]